MNLKGKTVLITGGRRVGGELALQLADRGANVSMTYHTSRQTIEATIAEVVQRGSQGFAVPADLSKADQAENAVSRTIERFQRLDVLVNMASIYKRTPFDSIQPGDFDEMIAANLAAPYHSAVASARRMLLGKRDPDSGLKGKIVNVCDWAVDRPYKDYLPYLIAKGGVVTMTLALAKELAPDVAVNAVLPAMVDPPPGLSESARKAVVDATPLGRSGTPADINNLILYLLEGTDYATGGLFRVDGGRFLGTDSAAE